MHLTALPDREVAALLVARPDLAAPPSSSFLALATRAGAQGSIEHALAGLDAPTLAVAEAVVALSGPTESEETEGSEALKPPRAMDPMELFRAKANRPTRLALIWPGWSPPTCRCLSSRSQMPWDT
ncbi:hypothetical protein BKH05_10655 [Actinomyces naeslundii]|nr:hypothetical protein BKH05_10655 [Actinomyces naeslundii]